MQLEFAAPSSALVPYVSLFYRRRDEESVVEGVERADVGQVRFMLDGVGSMGFPGGYHEQASRVMIIGPGTGASSYRVAGPCDCFGFALRPIGWGAIIGLPADDLADHLTDGDSLFGDDARVLAGDLADCATLEEMVDCVTPFLLDRIAGHPVPVDHRFMAEAVRLWLVQDGPIDVADLFAALPWSPRQVTRLVNRYFGGPPKFLERKFRALRAASAIVAGGDPADIATAFYDQSYMINEVRHFTGHTPGELTNGIDPLLAMTLADSRFGELNAVADPELASDSAG